MGQVIHSTDIVVIKDMQHQYTQVSEGYAHCFGYPEAKKVIGLNDFSIADYACKSTACSSFAVAEDFIIGDEIAFRGKDSYLLEFFPVLGEFNYFLTHKSPYYENNRIAGVKLHALKLGILQPTELDIFLKNKNISISSHTRELMETVSKNTPFNPYSLSPRELQCLRLLVAGYTSKEIGEQLEISYRTVETHIENIKHKMRVDKIRCILAKAYTEQLV
jgi:DNA-binding CsgD family transcriptional regulator